MGEWRQWFPARSATGRKLPLAAIRTADLAKVSNGWKTEARAAGKPTSIGAETDDDPAVLYGCPATVWVGINLALANDGTPRLIASLPHAIADTLVAVGAGSSRISEWSQASLVAS
jgi:hypothetical protein